MRVLKRPAKPATWGATVRKARREINKVGRSGGQPDFKDETKHHWRTFKKDLEDPETKMFRCAYCEVSLAGDRYRGDVEHYRPKAAATDRKWSKKRNGQTKRSWQNRCTPGYYWLAYEWSNLLLACSKCNKQKANFFPIVGATGARILTEGCEKTETPLLLNPYKDKHPEKHLEFGKLGEVSAAGSGIDKDRGHETIEICDLDRDELRKERMALADSAFHDIKTYLKTAKAGKDPDAVKGQRESLLKRMAPEHPHSGMIRIIFYQVTKQHWTAI